MGFLLGSRFNCGSKSEKMGEYWEEINIRTQYEEIEGQYCLVIKQNQSCLVSSYR